MADPIPLLGLVDVAARYADRPIFENVTFTINAGDRLGLLGVNGSGKSTLLRIAAGVSEPDAGDLRPRRELDLSYLEQELSFQGGSTVRAWVEGAIAHVRVLESKLASVHDALAEAEGDELQQLLDEQADLQRRVEQQGAYDAHARIDAMSAALGLPDGDRRLDSLSGGEKRRVGLCRALLEEPDLLILDEPTNHLDAETLDWLEEHLLGCRSALLFVTHDRYFLDRVANRLLELHRGSITEFDGGYGGYLEAKQRQESAAERAEDNRQRTLRRELEWYRRQPKARTTKSKARIQSIHQLEEWKPLEEAALPSFRFPDAPRLGKQALEAQHLRVERGGRVLVEDLNFILGPKDRIGIVGKNGAGKTSLVRALLGIDRPASGRVATGSNFTPLYADQERDVLRPDKTVLEEVTGDVDWVRLGGERLSVRAYMRRFLFDDLLMARPVGLLSGGERNRVMLARLIKNGGNVAVLDEPTNDLDLQTLRVLEDAILDFDGAAILISHDRYFLERLATRILWMEGDGQVHEIAGAYREFVRYRAGVRADRARLAAEAEPASSSPSPRERNSSNSRQKLSYREQQEFDGMEDRILAAETRLEELDAELHSSSLYERHSGEEVKALLAEKEELQPTIERLYARWAELSERAQ